MTDVAEVAEETPGARVRRYREAKGLHQREMAERIGCATQTYAGIEKGREGLTTTRMLSICEVLGVDANTILGLRSDGYSLGYKQGYEEGFNAALDKLHNETSHVYETLRWSHG